MQHRYRFAAVILFAELTLATNALHAQVLYGSLTGNVTDAGGGAVAGAKIEVLDTATGVSREVAADEHGVYLISNLQAGTYRVTISAASFQTVVEQNVAVDANTVRREDAQLQVAQVNQSVTVNAAAVPLQTDRADVSTEIGSAPLANLPLGANRNFETLYKLVPGTTPPVPAHSTAGNPTGALAHYTNGASDTANLTRIDGTADPNFWELNIIAYVPPAEAIQAVNIVTGSYNAEQGTAGGSVTNITIKSGTNAFHGSAWEYNTNSDLKARNFFYYGANNPKNILNQYGLALGGPIKKNKLFFFADWEAYRSRENYSPFQTVPTNALRQGNFVGTGTTIYNPFTGNSNGTGRIPFANNQIPSALLSPAAQKMAALIPEPNQTNGIANDYMASGVVKYDRDNVDLKINYDPSDRGSLFGRYSALPSLIYDPQALGPAGGVAMDGLQPGNAPGLTQSAALGGTYSFTPHLLFDGNIGFTRQNLVAEPPDEGNNLGLNVLGIPGTNGPNPLQGGYPNFQISGFSSLGNSNNSNPFVFRDNEYLYATNLGWEKGSHSIRFGFEFDRYQLNHYQAFQLYGVRGGFTFTGGLTASNGGAAPTLYNAWADFLLGLPQGMGKDYQYMNPATGRESVYSAYAQDQWQVTRKLTVNYGLRYEAYPFPTRDHFGGSNYDPSTNLALLGGVNGVPENAGVNAGYGQFAPRIGVAYRLDEKTVVRSGWGISTDPYYFTYMIGIYPATISQQITGANSYSAAGSLTTGIPPLSGPDLSEGRFPLPQNVGTNAYPQNFNRGYSESYNFTVQRDFRGGFNGQAGYVGTKTVRGVAYVDINAAGPGSGNVGTPLYQSWGNPNTINELEPFNGGSYNALQTRLVRSMGSNGQFGAVYTYSKSIDYVDETNNSLMWSWAPMIDRNKALAGYDRTHNLQLFGVYSLPFGHGQRFLTHGVPAAILGGWSVNPILTYESGLPFSVTSSGTSVNAPGNTQTANQVLPTVAILGGHGPNEPYFNPYAFAPVTGVTFGTSGRNILRGPGLFNLDMSLNRDFFLTERLKLQFRAEAYGLTNTPQFANPGATVSNARFTNGTITNYNGYDIISSSSGERQIRFALKLYF